MSSTPFDELKYDHGGHRIQPEETAQVSKTNTDGSDGRPATEG